SMEVSIFEADIEIVADRHVGAGEQLPSELAIAAAELMHAGVAKARSDSAAETVIAAEVEPAVEHRRPGIGLHVDVEIVFVEDLTRPQTQQGEQFVVEIGI